jgi:DNA-binding MarR family transcriptional regulator
MALEASNGGPPDPAETGEQRPNEIAFRSLVRTYGLLSRAMQPFFMRFGITVSQFAVLRTLRCAEAQAIRKGQMPTDADGTCHGLRQMELGDRLLVRPPSVTGVIDRLERQGLVCRGPSPDDLRAKFVHLTDAGRRLMDRVEGDHAQRMNQVLIALSVPEQKELSRLLNLLGSHLEAICDREELPPPPGPAADPNSPKSTVG